MESDDSELYDIVTGIMIRSRLKPKTGFADDFDSFELSLFVYLDCDERPTGDVFLFDYDIDLARISMSKNEFIRTRVNGVGHGNYGIGDKAFIEQSVRKGVENAVTDYLQSNFDLGGSEN